MAIKRDLYEMAYGRSKIIDTCKRFRYIVEVHIVKAVVYGNSTKDLKHWVQQELSNYISIISSMKSKPKNRKLKISEYQKYLFDDSCDNIVDAKTDLRIIQIDLLNDNYPDFDITDDIVERFWGTFTQVRNIVCNLLVEDKEYSKEDIAEKIIGLFE